MECEIFKEKHSASEHGMFGRYGEQLRTCEALIAL